MKVYMDNSNEYRIKIEYLDFGILKKVETVKHFKKPYQAKNYLMAWHDCISKIEGIQIISYSWELLE